MKFETIFNLYYSGAKMKFETTLKLYYSGEKMKFETNFNLSLHCNARGVTARHIRTHTRRHIRRHTRRHLNLRSLLILVWEKKKRKKIKT
jgi:hypothetical protein